MSGKSRRKRTSVSGKTGYHHGGLRNALIDAALKLVIENGAENFSLADACRLAGVTTAAPYRHFRDREEIMAEVAARGFASMSASNSRAARKYEDGSLEAIIAMGQAYLRFAIKQQPLFRLMFGQDPKLSSEEVVAEKARDCFGKLIAQIEKYCEINGIKEDAQILALRMWTFVHGASALLVDEKYALMAPGLDVDKLIATTVPQFLVPASKAAHRDNRQIDRPDNLARDNQAN